MKEKSIYVIFTIGHSNRTIEVFVLKLKENNIDVVVDIRTFPQSRFCPHFNQNALHGTLAEATIKYLYRGKNLGGRGVNVDYEEAIDELVLLAEGRAQVCVMCSEGDYRDCHRYTTIEPSLKERGLSVVHIQYENESKRPTRK